MQKSYFTLQSAGTLTLVLRWVIGWTYFSAFWRRLVLENKLDPETTGYIGEKFNHFLPNALGIKPIIEYLVTHPEALWWAMAVFTIVEALVGLCIILGLFTRLMAFGVFNLAMGILLGSGWIGTTCLDEWQIGVLGIAVGFVLMLSGSGRYSLDAYFLKRKPQLAGQKWFEVLASGPLPVKQSLQSSIILTGSIFITVLTLYTNQVFHGGVWGTLHNKSVKPKLELTALKTTKEGFEFTVFRVEGADVYGSFLTGITVLDRDSKPVFHQTYDELARLPQEQIRNHYIAKVKPGKHALIIPLGAKATITLPAKALPGYTLILTDISGATWQAVL